MNNKGKTMTDSEKNQLAAQKNQQIAKKLVALRKEKEITQEQLAEKIGLSKSAIAMYENGFRFPNDKSKKKIASFYNTTIGELFY